MFNKNNPPKEVVRAADKLLDYINGAKTTDEAAINLALAIDEDKLRQLAASFRNAERRYVTKQVSPRTERRSFERSRRGKYAAVKR